MVTREIKAGIVVAGSFLCLFGVVLLSGLKSRDRQLAAAEPPASAFVPDVPAAAVPTAVPAPVVAQETTKENPETKRLEPVPETPPLQPTPETAPFRLVSNDTKTSSGTTPAPANNAQSPAEQKKEPPAATESKPPVLPTLPDKPDATPPAPAAPESTPPAAPQPGPTPPKEKPDDKPVFTIPLPDAPVNVPKPETSNPAAKDLADKPERDKALPSDKKPTETSPVVPALQQPNLATTPDARDAPEKPAVVEQTPTPPSVPQAERKEPPAPEPPAAAPKLPDGSREPLRPTMPGVETPSRPSGEAPQRPVPPPLGSVPTAVAPTFAIPAPAASRPAATGPRVESYDEESYHVQPGDSYRGISRTFYNTDRYEKALALFNRAHPQASEGARQDPPMLQAGQMVFIPPIRILEREYGAEAVPPAPIAPAAVPAAPAGLPAAPATVPQAGLDVPRPLAGPSLPRAPVRESPRSLSPSGGERRYRVPGAGEMFLEIARRTLGSGERWVEIYQLNRQYNPAERVPAGSVLRLPADANVGANEAP